MILMKQTRSVEGIKRNAKPSIKKVGTMLGAGAMTVLMLGTVSVFGLTGTEITGRETKPATEGKTSAVATADEERTTETETMATSSAAVSWWKAGVEEYDLVEAQTTTAASTTAKKTTTTTKAATTKKNAETTTTTANIKSVNKTLYVTEPVNMRVGPSKDYDVVIVMDTDSAVKCSELIDDEWYKVSYNGYEGYCMAEYLTAEKPAETTAATTTAKKTTTTKATTTAKQTTTAKKTTTTTAAETAAPASTASTISYTVEELTMMCYVLQSEVGGCSDASKIAVANVIINRVKSDRFPNTLSGVLTQANQFTAIYNYYNRTNAPTQNTIECAKRALSGEGAAASNGATYYYAPKYCGGASASWFESLTFCMELEGQRFFKN